MARARHLADDDAFLSPDFAAQEIVCGAKVPSKGPRGPHPPSQPSTYSKILTSLAHVSDIADEVVEDLVSPIRKLMSNSFFAARPSRGFAPKRYIPPSLVTVRAAKRQLWLRGDPKSASGSLELRSLICYTGAQLRAPGRLYSTAS
jgi:hypothetical protein